jgi:hypothetical protein
MQTLDRGTLAFAAADMNADVSRGALHAQPRARLGRRNFPSRCLRPAPQSPPARAVAGPRPPPAARPRAFSWGSTQRCTASPPVRGGSRGGGWQPRVRRRGQTAGQLQWLSGSVHLTLKPPPPGLFYLTYGLFGVPSAAAGLRLGMRWWCAAPRGAARPGGGAHRPGGARTALDRRFDRESNFTVPSPSPPHPKVRLHHRGVGRGGGRDRRGAHRAAAVRAAAAAGDVRGRRGAVRVAHPVGVLPLRPVGALAGPGRAQGRGSSGTPSEGAESPLLLLAPVEPGRTGAPPISLAAPGPPPAPPPARLTKPYSTVIVCSSLSSVISGPLAAGLLSLNGVGGASEGARRAAGHAGRANTCLLSSPKQTLPPTQKIPVPLQPLPNPLHPFPAPPQASPGGAISS